MNEQDLKKLNRTEDLYQEIKKRAHGYDALITTLPGCIDFTFRLMVTPKDKHEAYGEFLKTITPGDIDILRESMKPKEVASDGKSKKSRKKAEKKEEM